MLLYTILVDILPGYTSKDPMVGLTSVVLMSHERSARTRKVSREPDKSRSVKNHEQETPYETCSTRQGNRDGPCVMET